MGYLYIMSADILDYARSGRRVGDLPVEGSFGDGICPVGFVWVQAGRGLAVEFHEVEGLVVDSVWFMVSGCMHDGKEVCIYTYAALKSSTVFFSFFGSIPSFSARPSMVSDCSGSLSVVS